MRLQFSQSAQACYLPTWSCKLIFCTQTKWTLCTNFLLLSWAKATALSFHSTAAPRSISLKLLTSTCSSILCASRFWIFHSSSPSPTKSSLLFSFLSTKSSVFYFFGRNQNWVWIVVLFIVPVKSHLRWWRRSFDREERKSNSHQQEIFEVLKCYSISKLKWSVGLCVLQIQSCLSLSKLEALDMAGNGSPWKQSRSLHPSTACWTHSSAESSTLPPLVQGFHTPCFSQPRCNRSPQSYNIETEHTRSETE